MNLSGNTLADYAYFLLFRAVYMLTSSTFVYESDLTYVFRIKQEWNLTSVFLIKQERNLSEFSWFPLFAETLLCPVQHI